MARWLVSLVVCSAFLASSCGETSVDLSQGDAEGPPLSVSYLIEGGSADEFHSFFLTVDDIRLLGPEDLASGSAGVGALPGPMSVELLGLEDRAQLLTTRYYGDGLFTHVRLDLGRDVPRAIGHDGQEAVWESAGGAAGTNSLVIELEEPLRPVRGESLNRTIVLHVSPGESVLHGFGPLGDKVYRFEPIVRARVLRGNERVTADDFWGGLQWAAADLRSVEIASDMNRTTAERAVVASVLVESSTLLLQPSGQPATSLAGLSATPELADARFWVRGEFLASRHSYLPELRASSVLLDSLMPASGSDAAIVAEVRVVGALANGVFVVRPIEIERGAAEVQSAVGALDQPFEWRVHLDTSATVLTASQSLGSRTNLRVGARVKLHFPSFAVEPFEARRAVLQGRPEHFGRIVEAQVSDLRASVQLDEDAPAIEAGQVADSSTTVSVETTSLFALLDLEGGQIAYVRDLQPGVRVAVRGRVTGAAESPEIESAALVVRPGRFRGFVSSISEADGSFDATVESIDEPFGGQTESPPFRVTIQGSAFLEGEAATRPEFFELFRGLTGGERLAVTVAGLGTGTPNEVKAYQIRACVK